jgi:hypothetical protein
VWLEVLGKLKKSTSLGLEPVIYSYLQNYFLTFKLKSAPIGTVMSMVIVAKVHRFVQSGI